MAYTLSGQGKTDEEKFRAYVVGTDKAPIADLFKQHLPLVYGVCMKYLKEREEAKDATMEVFERLLSYRPQNPVKNFRAYLYVMTRNHCLMKMRGEKHYIKEITETDMEIVLEVHPIDMDDNKITGLEKCIGQLKDLQKTCVEAFYLQGHSYNTVAETYGITLASVKSHIQNGKRNLKNCLEGADETR